MPSDHYYLQVQHADICLLEAATSTVTAIDFGSTEIVLIDASIHQCLLSSLVMIIILFVVIALTPPLSTPQAPDSSREKRGLLLIMLSCCD